MIRIGLLGIIILLGFYLGSFYSTVYKIPEPPTTVQEPPPPPRPGIHGIVLVPAEKRPNPVFEIDRSCGVLDFAMLDDHCEVLYFITIDEDGDVVKSFSKALTPTSTYDIEKIIKPVIDHWRYNGLKKGELRFKFQVRASNSPLKVDTTGLRTITDKTKSIVKNGDLFRIKNINHVEFTQINRTN